MASTVLKVVRYLLPVVMLALAALPALAQDSDSLFVFDPNGVVVAGGTITEDDEIQNPDVIWIINDPTLADPAQFGNLSLLYRPGGDPTNPQDWSDVFGVARDAAGNFFLAFSSETEGRILPFGDLAVIFIEENQQDPSIGYDATMYLNPALQAQGFTAIFFSDFDGGPQGPNQIQLGSGLSYSP